MEALMRSSPVVNEKLKLITSRAAVSADSEESAVHVFKVGFVKVDVPAPTTSNRCRLGRLLDKYAEALEGSPLLLKAVTSGLMAALGDLISQTIFWAQDGELVWHNKEAMRRTLAVAMDGVLFNAPILHYVYGALDQWMPAEEKTSNAAMQVAIDILVISPVYALMFIFTTGFFEGKSVEGYMVPLIKADYLSIIFCLIVAGIIFAPVYVFLFKHLPLKWRVLISDGTDLLWTVIATYIIGPGH